jgi:hypothetical protein
MKKQLPKETIIEMNEKFWEQGISIHQVARNFKISLPVAQRVLTLTRAEFQRIKEQIK